MISLPGALGGICKSKACQLPAPNFLMDTSVRRGQRSEDCFQRNTSQ